MSSRREFFQKLMSITGLAALVNFYSSCNVNSRKKKIPGSILGASATAGHILRDRKIETPSEVELIDLVIVGGGISGLAAANYLNDQGETNFLLLELEKEPGGNAVSGKNSTSAYPWGAHYLPLPNPENIELLGFLKANNIITHVDHQGLPHYNEFYLCHDPEERLYIHGHWQNGLIPHLGVPQNEKNEINRFLSEMNNLKTTKGKDGKFAFDIPVDLSSEDEEFRRLDTISMYEYMVSQNYKSPCLHWYVNYSCRDDYGTDIQNTSAWAGLHYFASRRGVAANAETSSVLTWPEGNGFLVNLLKKKIRERIRANVVVYSVDHSSDGVYVDYLEYPSGKLKRIHAKKCIVATPQFVNKKILRKNGSRTERDYSSFSYAPWMIANLTVGELKERLGRPLSWDNVFYDGKSLGFINANHQQLDRSIKKRVLTCYFPLTDTNPVNERIQAYNRSHEQWMEIILKDFQKAYPSISDQVHHADIWVWGHGMIRPVKGFIKGVARKEFQKNIDGKIFFAHSDLSGISIFEEAFYHGTRAAKEVLQNI